MKKRTTLLTLLAVCLMLVACDTKTKNVDSCGDGFADPGEQCDTTVGENSCASLGYYNALGVLRCTQDCQFDDSSCGGRCGDSLVQEGNGETCDGGNLNGQTCQSLGYTGGTLECGAGCTYDVSGCAGRCGNGVIDEDEVCDGGELAEETCQTQGYHGGALGCEADCSGYNLDACTAVGRCGDAVIQSTYGEVCDGGNLDGETCVSQGYYSGTLACDSTTCQFDFAGCGGACGDGVLQEEHGEECEVTDLGGETCETLGLYAGTLACGSNCQMVTSGCGGRCSDGIIQSGFGEECDGANVGGVSCMSLGFTSGMIVCDFLCGLDDTSCSMNYESPNIGTLIYVPAGTFQRDSTATNLSTVSAFRMSQYEITRAQWVAVTGWADPSDPGSSSGTSDPVQKVSWYDAIAFCNKLSLAEGLTPVYAVSGVDFANLTYAQLPTWTNATWDAATVNWTANGYRLPTEMEWMWAAMGADSAAPGVTNTTGYLKAFAGSTGMNSIDDYAWYDTNSLSKTNPTGSKLHNELGFHDFSGNVFEWAWDWYGTYPTGSVTNYRGPASGTNRAGRGGSWQFNASYCIIPFRYDFYSYYRFNWIGFRVVRP